MAKEILSVIGFMFFGKGYCYSYCSQIEIDNILFHFFQDATGLINCEEI